MQLKIDSALKPKIDSVLPVAEIKMSYNLAIANGRSSYLKNDLVNAKIFYEEAMNLQPSQQEPKNQLKIINNKLEDLARETEINNNYERNIALADSQVIAKAYDSAIPTYKQASILKPLESYPKKQLKYIQSELALNEKRKRKKEEDIVMHLPGLIKQWQIKNMMMLNQGISEALAIHPDNEYAKRRLEIISYQIEKARLEKLSQDSVKEVVPVKNQRRKR